VDEETFYLAFPAIRRYFRRRKSERARIFVTGVEC